MAEKLFRAKKMPDGRLAYGDIPVAMNYLLICRGISVGSPYCSECPYGILYGTDCSNKLFEDANNRVEELRRKVEKMKGEEK